MMLERTLAWLIVMGAYAVCFVLLGYCILSGAAEATKDAREREETKYDL
jgi:hypothetical protein